MDSHKQQVSVYLPDSLHQSLVIYQEQKEFNSVSAAVVEILTQFFQLSDRTQRYATVEQLEALEVKLLA